MKEEEVEVEESKKEEREEEEVIRTSVAMHQSCSCGPRGFFISSAQ